MTKDATWSSLADRSTLTFTVYSFQMCTDFRNSFTSWFTRKFSTYTPQISASAAIRCYTTLSKSKIQKKCYWFWQHPQETVDMFLRTLSALHLRCLWRLDGGGPNQMWSEALWARTPRPQRLASHLIWTPHYVNSGSAPAWCNCI